MFFSFLLIFHLMTKQTANENLDFFYDSFYSVFCNKQKIIF